MWFYNDVSNILSSVSLTNGTTINSYSGIRLRQKKNYDSTTFKIIYDLSTSSDFIRYSGVIDKTGVLSQQQSVDFLTSFILSNKNFATFDLTANISNGTLSISKGTLVVENIDLGNKQTFGGFNWYFDDSNALWVSINVRNMNSQTWDERIIVINKSAQKYNISGMRFNTVADGTGTVNSNQLIDQLLNKSNGIIRIQDQTRYPLGSNILIAFYDDDSACVKYFDPYDGLIHRLEDVVVYDGVFFYRNTNYGSYEKEFAIWDKMHASMQYHDDLPSISFDQYDATGFVADYMYDNSSLYIMAYLGSIVNEIELKLGTVTCIDYNNTLAQYAVSIQADGIIEEQIFDFTGINPYGYLLIERSDKVQEILSSNRSIKITVDTTFDLPNLIGLDTLYPVYNPFGNCVFFYTAESSMSLFKSASNWKSNYYYDYINSSTIFSSLLSPNWDWHNSASYPDQTLGVLGSGWLTSDSSSVT
jgi:hypothetical protein